MEKEEKVERIIGAVSDVGRSLKDLGVKIEDVSLDENSRFSDAKFLDSMSIVELQMKMAEVFGDAANENAPTLDMKIGEYADKLK